MIFSEKRLKTFMNAKRITSAELAQRAGLSKEAVSWILNRNKNPKIETIRKLARALDIGCIDLMESPFNFFENDLREMTRLLGMAYKTAGIGIMSIDCQTHSRRKQIHIRRDDDKPSIVLDVSNMNIIDVLDTIHSAILEGVGKTECG